MQRSEHCLKHCLPHDLQNILGEEGRKPNEQYLTIWSFTKIVTSVRTSFQTKRHDKDYKDKIEQFQKVQRTNTRTGSKDEYLHRG